MTTCEPRVNTRQLVELARRTVGRVDLRSLTRARFVGQNAPSAILAVGKCAGAMLEGARQALPGGWSGAQVAILPDGSPAPAGAEGLAVLRCSHPFPDVRVNEAAAVAMDLAAGASARRPLWLCLSGGGSACLGAPLPPLTTHELKSLTRTLMMRGASIRELNTVRKQLCRVVGGKLGAVARGLVAAVAVDIAEEDVSLVASGPACPDTSRPADALEVLRTYGLADETDVLTEILTSPRPASPCADWPHVAVATPSVLRNLLVEEAQKTGQPVHCIMEPLRDPAAVRERLVEPARREGGLWLDVSEVAYPVPAVAPPGGRCAHMALELAVALRGSGTPFSLVAMGSDGRDGPTQSCGAAVDEHSLDRVATAVTQLALERGNAHSVLSGCGALLPRFPSTINLLDMHLLWMPPPA